MPLPALLLLIATLLPLIGALLLIFSGRKLGDPFAGIVGTIFIGGSLCCSLVALTSWLSRDVSGLALGQNAVPICITAQWIPVGVAGDPQGVGQDHAGALDVGIYIDSLTLALFNMITLVATLIHVFAIAYMRRERDFARFFAYLSFFCFAMLSLVLSATLLQILVFWELVGLSSFLLIGFWHQRAAATRAATKAFIVNRIGDLGFLVGLGLLILVVGNVTLPKLWLLLGNAGAGQGVILPGGQVVSDTLLTLAGIGLFLGAAGKSAQFPLHVWLPDAMEGPSPVSALIHAATMVAAGVYLVARIFPILTPDAKLYIAITGVITLTLGALCALVQRDIKRVLAYSTISQLGYMMLAVGVGSWAGGLFHLVTHAFFKALLFLGAGSVIHAMHHEQRLGQYGGLLTRLPVTAVTFGVAVLAIAGTPFLSGFYSKEMILVHAAAFVELSRGQGLGWMWELIFILPAIVAYVTAFYMTRCWMLTFWGKPRNHALADAARERPTMWVPLIALAAMSIIAGTLLGVREMLESAMSESTSFVRELAGGRDSPDPFATAWPIDLPKIHESPESLSPLVDAEPESVQQDNPHLVAGLQRAETATFWAFLGGILPALIVYSAGAKLAARVGAWPGVKQVRAWIEAGFYFDVLYAHVFQAVTLAFSRLAAGFDVLIIDPLIDFLAGTVRRLARFTEGFDRFIVDGAVGGVSTLWQVTGSLVRLPQAGAIRIYITLTVAILTLGIAWIVWWN